ncbi:tetratricopeptide repeat protein [Granulicella tundricola]|uniref:Tetratricopeptide TPR_1 repeat-containing protein n=1 Tax=Granulicella tundricola (strain ATCC BAA-1859 / DSM 23138 / MP5ACTX9) TaxID=1198114 RepID=E8X2M4_GRATM|nr:tetratricopeptide repeat protein [Granulicella tundricola]ADW70321.1 Tetratricopeptide TPR_1 repeat-containing protein [Granulicella tundricola MP5ACTX9]
MGRSASNEESQATKKADRESAVETLAPLSLPANVLRILPLPFEVIHNAGERNQIRQAMAAFADELRDEITVVLAQSNLGPVIVSARSLPSPGTGSFSLLKTVAREFEASLLLRVTLRYTGTATRIFMQMLDGEDLKSIWSHRLDRESTARSSTLTWFPVTALADAVREHAGRRRGAATQPAADKDSLSLSAYNLGVHYWNQRSRTTLPKALTYFEDAVALNPNCAEAYAGLANAYVSVSFNDLIPPRDAALKAYEAVQKAVKLNKDSLPVRTALVNVLTNCTWDWARAEQECRASVEAGVMDARMIQLYSSLVGCQGRHEEALSLAMHALRLDPEIPASHSQIAQAYLYAGDYANALNSAKKYLMVRPDFATAHALLTRILAVSGDWDGALTECQTAVEISGRSPSSLALMAYVQAGRGDVQAANSMLDLLRTEVTGDFFPSYEVSAVHAALKQEGQAIEQLYTACRQRDMKTIHMNYDPRFEHLRTLPAFQELATIQTQIM